MPTSAEIRARAREYLKGNWGQSIGFMLIMALLGVVVGIINLIPIVGWIVSILVAGPFMLCYAVFFLRLARGESPSIGVALEGFQRFFKAFLLYLLQSIFVFLWTLLLIIPGIIAALRYSMAWFVLQDNPDIGTLEAIERSKSMMVGQKGRLFVLYLTFIGWFILCLFTLGIGYLWLYPYIQTAKAAFYQDLLNRNAGFADSQSGLTM